MWDEFARNSKNSSFLHQRRYMDYHSERFADHSLIAADGGRTLALLPANEDGTTIHSHQGLTYGGWLTPMKHFNANTMLEVFASMKEFLHSEGFTRLIYKAVPHIYHRYPAEEDAYALFRFGARVSGVNMSSTVIPSYGSIPVDERSRRNLKNAVKAGVDVRESTDFAAFWEILTENLSSKYGARPVHSLAEMTLLHSRFPESIRLFLAYLDGTPVAGTVIFDTATVAHTQYIAATGAGLGCHALAMVWHKLITETFSSRPFFDFGTSNENNGLILNHTLLQSKAGYGARGIAYVIYEMDI